VTVPSHDEIQRAAGTFLDVAFESLAKLRVVPTPIYHPHLEVGRDYSGSAVGNLQEFRDLEAALDQAYPERFDEATAGLASDFSSHWIYSLLEASVARCSIRGEQLASSSPAVAQTIDELITVLSEPLASVIVCRAAPHLATEDGQPLTICDLEILPNADGRQMIPQIIPLGASAFNRDPPFVYDPPQALIVARDHGPNPYQTASEASARIDTFLLAIRLLYASTAWTAYEVQGPASLVDPTGARLTTADRDRSLVRRTLRLGPEHGAPVTALTAVLDAANAVPPAMMFTSFGMALTRFSESYQGNAWDGQLLSLTTALEGAISGSETNDVILRLRTRAAALIAEDDDPPVNIFEDIGRIYELRSKLAHGGTYKIDRFKAVVYKMSTVPEEAPLGVAVGYMIDRLRDLVRRAILARLFLAARDEPLWALSDDLGVDAHLTNDATRATWKSAWRASLAEIGAPESRMRASLAQDYLSRDDR
jgi:hypothetical protein